MAIYFIILIICLGLYYNVFVHCYKQKLASDSVVFELVDT